MTDIIARGMAADAAEKASGASSDIDELNENIDNLTDTVDEHIGDTVSHVTASDKTKWNTYETDISALALNKADKSELPQRLASENHNNIFRGDDLFAKGYTIDSICAMIADGSFSDIYIGDYFTLSGSIPNVPCYVEQTSDDGTKTLVESTQTVNYNTKFRIAGLDMYLNTGDNAIFSKHHAVLVPDGIIGINRMNGSNITTGGYLNSFMFASVLPVYNTHFSAADKFGSHLLTYRNPLSSAVSGNASSNWIWTDVKISLMSEPEAYGCMIFGGKYDVGANYKQLPLFRIAPKFVCNRNWYWLRAVAFSAGFANVSGGGDAAAAYSSTARGVRPLFVIG